MGKISSFKNLTPGKDELVKVQPWGFDWGNWPQRKDDDGELTDVYDEELRSIKFTMSAPTQNILKDLGDALVAAGRTYEKSQGANKKGFVNAARKIVNRIKDWEDSDPDSDVEIEAWADAKEPLIQFLAEEPLLLNRFAVAYGSVLNAQIEKKTDASGVV